MPVQKRKGHAARAGNNSPKLNRGIGYVVAAIALAVLLIATVPGLGRTLATLLGLVVAGATALKVFGSWRGRKEEVAVQSLRVFKDAQPMAEPQAKAKNALDADLQARRTEEEAQRETQRQVERDLENLRERTTAALNQRASATKARKTADERLATRPQPLKPPTPLMQGHAFAGDTPERQKRLEELVAKRRALEAELQVRRNRDEAQRETHRQVERDLETLRARTKADLNKAWLEKEKQTSDRAELETQQTPQATQQPGERDLHNRQAVPDLSDLWFGPDNRTVPGETKQPAPPPDPWYAQMSRKHVEAAQRALSGASEQRAAMTEAKDAAASSTPAAGASAPWYSAVSKANHAASLRKLQDLEVSAARALEAFDRIAESITPRAVPQPSNPLGTVSQTAAPVPQPGPTTDELVEIYAPARSHGGNLTLPGAPEHLGQARWIPPNATVKVADLTISGGMVYVGTVLKSAHRNVDPGLLNPTLPVAATEGFVREDVPYWPTYADISPAQRRTYLQWLAGGRCDPAINVGYIFLFFYGLERRAIVDAADDEVAQADWISIENEVLRLLSIYGETATGFKRQAQQLLDWCRLARHTGRVYDQPLPEFEKNFEMPPYLKLALGYAALDKVPLTPALARLCVVHEPTTFLRTPATRCPEVFARLFEQKYQEAFPTGLLISPNRTKLKFVYHPASDALRSLHRLELSFNDVPDVSVLTAPFNKLRLIVQEATDELDSYSRYVGKNPDSVNSLDAVLLLPTSVWPAGAREELNKLKCRVSEQLLTLTFQELLDALHAKSTFTRDRTVSLARALQAEGIGMEPDVPGGARLPKLNEPVVLFEHVQDSASSPAYQTALLTLQLATAVVMADGSFSEEELQHLQQQIHSWSHLDAGHLRRLDAHLRLLALAPVPLTALRKKLEPLDEQARRTLASFMAGLAQADGIVTPDEVRMLEKVYKVLGVDSSQVFSDVHAAATGATAHGIAPSDRSADEPTTASAVKAGFSLNTARIAAVQQDTARVSSLLGTIFDESQADVKAAVPSAAPAAPFVAAGDMDQAEGVTAPGHHDVLGLDERHARLARLLLSRLQWSRAELTDAAADLELMVDGALERINDACFEQHDQPFIEGDDPLDVNPEIVELLVQA